MNSKPATEAPPAASLLKLKRILVPVDYSACSKEALDFAVSFARQFGAGLVVLHVVVPSYEINPYGMNIPGYFEPDIMRHAREQLDAFVRNITPPEFPVENLVRAGRPAIEINEAARELEADLIIISTHGHTGLQHIVFGSTAEYVVRRAKCPVLVLRSKEQPTNPKKCQPNFAASKL